jgi:dipeptidyl aminopeptidase/acylaminoacyl peptidase
MTDSMTGDPAFDLRYYLTLPRVGGLALSPDDSRLVAPVAEVAPDGKKFVSALWEIDPSGERPARRLTRSTPGEAHGDFLPDGSLLFTSRRPDPDIALPKDGTTEKDREAALWLLPAGGGEARVVADPPGGVGIVRAARDSGTVVYGVHVLPGVADLDADKAKAKERRDKDVQAQLFEQYPIRVWDHYVGPRQTHLFVAQASADGGRLADQRDLTQEPGWSLEVENLGVAVTPDGRTVVATWRDDVDDVRDQRASLVAIDTAGGERTVLAADAEHDYGDPACSPDGRWVVCVRGYLGNYDEPMDLTLWLIDLSTGEGRDLTPDLDLWPHAPVWSPAGDAVFFCADEAGKAPVFRVDVEQDGSGGKVTRLTAAGSWSHPCPSSDGTVVYALHNDHVSPPQPYRLDGRAADQDGTALSGPGLPLRVAPPGRVESIIATTQDGAQVQSWLVLPEGASAENPAPLAVFIHGGPLASWTGWQWRWNPQLLAARGYAVLLPNPALSTGFGLDFVRRGRGRWGDEPYTDVMAAVDAAVARPDIDAERTAALGGSFGGYMANWVAGHTDRFRCIVTHASLWALDQFHGSTDLGVWWEREFGDFYDEDRRERYVQNSPNRHVGEITTPMLVIHGELDHRVPISEGLRLWTDLRRHGVESKFLYFPDENHWILKPNNIVLWYESVIGWLDHYLLGEPWRRPSLV